MQSLLLQRLLWIYCTGYARVRKNKRIDRLDGAADITSGVQLGRVKVLRGSRNFLNMHMPEHHSLDCRKGTPGVL